MKAFVASVLCKEKLTQSCTEKSQRSTELIGYFSVILCVCSVILCETKNILVSVPSCSTKWKLNKFKGNILSLP